MANPEKNRCPNCKRLERRIAELEARVSLLAGELAKTQGDLAKATKNSSTSSKPPSSDIVKPQKKRTKGKRGKRKRGGQPGHPRHQRAAFAEEQLDQAWEYRLDDCPCCRGKLQDLDRPPKRLQQADLRPLPVVIEEHRVLPARLQFCFWRPAGAGRPAAGARLKLVGMGRRSSASRAERGEGVTVVPG